MVKAKFTTNLADTNIKQKDMGNMQNMGNDERYNYLITEILRNKQIWLLKAQDGFYAMFEDDNEQSYLPVWPDIDYAKSNTTDDWDGYEPEGMHLNEFMEWLDELHDDQIGVGAFPMQGMQAMAVAALEFKKILKSALR